MNDEAQKLLKAFVKTATETADKVKRSGEANGISDPEIMRAVIQTIAPEQFKPITPEARSLAARLKRMI